MRYLWAADSFWDTCEQLTACEILVSSWQLVIYLWAADSLWDTCEQLNPLSLSPRNHVTIEAATKFLSSSKRCHTEQITKWGIQKWIKLYIHVNKLCRAFRGAVFRPVRLFYVIIWQDVGIRTRDAVRARMNKYLTKSRAVRAVITAYITWITSTHTVIKFNWWS